MQIINSARSSLPHGALLPVYWSVQYPAHSFSVHLWWYFYNQNIYCQINLHVFLPFTLEKKIFAFSNRSFEGKISSEVVGTVVAFNNLAHYEFSFLFSISLLCNKCEVGGENPNSCGAFFNQFLRYVPSARRFFQALCSSSILWWMYHQYYWQ